jgi:hypothetical protein
MIRRRVSKQRELKDKLRDRTNPEARILRFLQEFGKRFEEEKTNGTEPALSALIQAESSRLMSDINLIDPEANLELTWYGDDVKSLQIDGVRIKWSAKYVEDHKIPDELYVDATSIFFR